MKLNLAKRGKVRMKVLSELGEGAQGKVYEVKNGVHETYALKVYDQDDEYSVAAQRRARKIGELIKNPQTGALKRSQSLDAGSDEENNPVMLYRLFKNNPIEDYHERYIRPKNLRVRERIAVGLTAGVVEIHRAKIIHADLAPINVLYSPKGAVSIIDFDGAGYQPENPKLAMEPIVKGHAAFPGWIAPYEIHNRATFGTDIWWTSSILMKVLSNFSPFFFLKVADESSLKELYELEPEPTKWPPDYDILKKHSKVQPNLNPAILQKVREVINMTIATKTLADVFINYTKPEERPTAVKLWSSFRSRVFK